MMKHATTNLIVVLGILLIGFSAVGYAEESGGVESINPAAYDDIGTPWQNGYGALPQPPMGYPNGYNAYPQPAPAQPQPKRSFLGRLFAPITNRMSPPIYQAPKYPKDKGLELQASSDPLVRLVKGAQASENNVIQPGFYLLRKEGGEKAESVFLTLVRGNEVLYRIPATQTSQEPAMATVMMATPTKDSNKKSKSSPTVTSPTATDKPKSKSPTAQVELAGDGQTMIFVYQQGLATWKSAPLPVADAWLH